MRSSAEIATGVVTRCPLTNVPLAELRSATIALPVAGAYATATGFMMKSAPLPSPFSVTSSRSPVARSTANRPW